MSADIKRMLQGVVYIAVMQTRECEQRDAFLRMKVWTNFLIWTDRL